MRDWLGNASVTIKHKVEERQPRISTSPSKHNQASQHTDVISKKSLGRGSGVATTTSGDDYRYIKLDEVTLPDGTNMRFYAHKDNAPTFDEIMDELYDLASEALVRKLSK